MGLHRTQPGPANTVREASRRLAALTAAFPLDPESREAIEVAAAVRRVALWVEEASEPQLPWRYGWGT